jgi:hypothetical protein
LTSSSNNGIFLFKKMKANRKLPTKTESVDHLRPGNISLYPLSFRTVEDAVESGENADFDTLVEVTWCNCH